MKRIILFTLLILMIYCIIAKGQSFPTQPEIKIKTVKSYYNFKKSSDIDISTHELNETYFPIGVNGKAIFEVEYPTLDEKSFNTLKNEYNNQCDKYEKDFLLFEEQIDAYIKGTRCTLCDTTTIKSKEMCANAEKLNNQLKNLRILRNTIELIAEKYNYDFDVSATYNKLGSSDSKTFHVPSFDAEVPSQSTGLLKVIQTYEYDNSKQEVGKTKDSTQNVKLKDFNEINKNLVNKLQDLDKKNCTYKKPSICK
jgi:hypothetical protein